MFPSTSLFNQYKFQDSNGNDINQEQNLNGNRRSSMLENFLSPKNTNMELYVQTSEELNNEFSSSLWGTNSFNSSVSSDSPLNQNLISIPYKNHNNNYNYICNDGQQTFFGNRRGSLDLPLKTNSDALCSPIWNNSQLSSNSSLGHFRFKSIDNSMFDQQPPSWGFLQNNHQSSPPPNRRGSLDSNGGFINEYQGIDSNNQVKKIFKSDETMKQAYQSIDSYFTFDQYNRITNKSYSAEYLQQLIEDLIQSGVQLPRFSGSQFISSSSQLVLICFKAGRMDVFYKSEDIGQDLDLKMGDLVIVEADRGCDLGKIIRLNLSLDEARLVKFLQHQEQQIALASFDKVGSSINIPTNLHFPKPILRLAMCNEALQLTNKNSDEERAKRICSLKVQSLNLSMCVIDAEYQSDRRKLTIYYNASHRIDFRDLVRDLFRIYKTRIWMCAVNSDISPEPISY